MRHTDINILNEVRKNCRRSLTEIGIATDTPLSTVFKRFERLHKRDIIKKHACLVDFALLGYPVKVGIFLSTNEREHAKQFLTDHPNVNTLFRLSGDCDFYAELVFENMLRFEDFSEELVSSGIVKKMTTHFIHEDAMLEDFKIGEQE